MPDDEHVPAIDLNDGTRIPQLGFGVFKIDQGETEETVAAALSIGYRHVDTAAAYANEAEVGRAVRGCGEHVYVTTKYFNPNDDHGYQDAKAAFTSSLGLLAMDHIDLISCIGRSGRARGSWSRGAR